MTTPLQEQMDNFQEALRLIIWFLKGGEMPKLIFCGTDITSVSFWRIFMKETMRLEHVSTYLSADEFQKVLNMHLTQPSRTCFQNFFDVLHDTVVDSVPNRDGICLFGSDMTDMKNWKVLQRGIFLNRLDEVMGADVFEMIVREYLEHHEQHPLFIPPEAFAGLIRQNNPNPLFIPSSAFLNM